ncbi:MAG: hypothetical protein ACE5H8_06535 [Alphaproteobacteria bacterium]
MTRRAIATAVLAARLVAGLVAGALAAAPAVAQQADSGLGEADWPCRGGYRPALAAAAVWTGPELGDARQRWRDDPAVRKLAERLASPETSPDQGVREIDRFAAALGDDRRRRLILLVAGLIEEINVYRRFAVAGVWEFTAKRRLLADVMAETETRYRALPYDGAAASEAERKRLEEQRFWQSRAYEDFDDEARYLCKRLVYLEGKLGALARAIAAHVAR